MATRALLPNIQLARARVKPQPRGETQRESEYRDTLQNIAATLSVIGQGVNLARATEPWWAGIGYGGAESPEIDAKASELSQQLANAYQSQAPQQTQQMPQPGQPGQPQPMQPERRGPSIMDRNDRRAAVEEIAGKPASAQAPQPATTTFARPQFNRIGQERQEPLLVRSTQEQLAQGAPLFQQQGTMQSPSIAQLQRQLLGEPLFQQQGVAQTPSGGQSQEISTTGLPQQSALAGQKPEMSGSDRALAGMRLPTEQEIIEKAHQKREEEKAERQRRAAQAAEQNIADAKQQEFFDAAAAAVPQESLAPPPPPADPVQRQAELQNIAKQTADPAAVVAAEIDRFSSVPVYTTFRETQARLASAVMDGDVNAAKLILQGAARSPMTDIRPTSLADRLSGAHARRAMTQLTQMTQGMAGLQQRAQNALIRADLAERRLVLDREKAAATDQHRAEQRALAGQRLALAREKAQAQLANIESMITSRGLSDAIKAKLAPVQEALMRGKTAQAYAIAMNARSSARGRDKIIVLEVARKIADLDRAYNAAGGEEAGYGDAPTLENLRDKIKRGDPIAPVREGTGDINVDVYTRKKSVDVADDLTRELLGLGGKGGRGKGAEKDSYLNDQEKTRLNQWYRRTSKFSVSGSTSRFALEDAIPALEQQAKAESSPKVREAMLADVAAWKAAVGYVEPKGGE